VVSTPRQALLTDRDGQAVMPLSCQLPPLLGHEASRSARMIRSSAGLCRPFIFRRSSFTC
jgi:hypothetical protein